MKKYPLLRGRSFDVRHNPTNINKYPSTQDTSSEADLKSLSDPSEKYALTGPFLRTLTRQLTALGLPQECSGDPWSSEFNIPSRKLYQRRHLNYTPFGSLSSLNFGGGKMQKSNSVKPTANKSPHFSIKHKPLKTTRSYYAGNKKDEGLKADTEFLSKPSSPNSSVLEGRDVLPSKPSFKKASMTNQAVPSTPHSHRCTYDVPDTQAFCISQVTRNLFIGSVDALYDDSLLCHFSIDYLIDVTNIAPDCVPQVHKSSQKCSCPDDVTHFRPKLCVELSSTTELEFLEDMFEEVNRFIETARYNSRNVLIASYNGETRCGLLAMQYVIKYWHYSVQDAFNHLKSFRSVFFLTSDHRRALILWEKKQRRIWIKSGALPLNSELLQGETIA